MPDNPRADKYNDICWCHNPETSAPPDPFEKAWKAIEDGEISKLEQAVQEMKESESGSSAPLDTCRLTEKSGVAYSMSLLALCGFHGRRDMVDLLLKEGADMKAKSACKVHTGIPICQMMLHVLIQEDYEKLSIEMLEYFIKKGAELSGEIFIQHVGLDHSDSGGFPYGMLDLPLSMKRIDCAKLLVEKGVDLISGGSPEGEELFVVPMFQEYRDYGTNEFIHWAFNEYLPQHPEIDLKRIIQSIINMKEQDEKSCFWQSVQRAPAHAILTSQHEETIKRLVEYAKNFKKLDLLGEQSCTGMTALHVAAENDDVESVCILLQLGADTRAYDNSDMNPFMIAIDKGHMEVVKAMKQKDPGLVSFSVGSGSTMIHWALEKSHHRSAYFKDCFKRNPKDLLTSKDSQGNTLAHLAAASGNTELFETKVLCPQLVAGVLFETQQLLAIQLNLHLEYKQGRHLFEILWSEEFADAIFSEHNSEDKTPLQVAIKKGHVNILKKLEFCVDGGKKCTAPQWLRKLKKEWWSKVVPCLLYASSCGSLDAVKHFIASGQEPSVSDDNDDGKTPLLCAAEAGHDEIVAYLLRFRKVQTYLKNQPKEVESTSKSPLLIASQNGHTKCVTLLLQNGGNVLQRDSEDRNCLMIAIQNHHKDTALAILYEEKNALQSLSYKNPTPQKLFGRRDKKLTPLQLLVEEMPDLAEYVLNKCVTQEQEISITGEGSMDGPTVAADRPVHYNFDFLEDKDHGSDILLSMCEHENLLCHPLVGNFIFQKFWMMTFPLLLLNVLLYCMILVGLNIFALVVPRPGPDSETCPENTLVFFNGTNSECPGQSEYERTILAGAAILLHFLSLTGFVVEVVQFWMRGLRYFNDVDSYFQLALYTLTRTFINGFDGDCWCSTPGQWQIGAFAVFFSWVNFIFVLKYIPYTAVPISIFFSICAKTLKLLFLSILLIFAFGVPFYMVFVRTTFSSEEFGSLVAFRSPGHAIAKTVVQLVGEFDFEDTFKEGTLLYSPAAYILFFTFLITMPILFTNFLTSLAVGEAEKKRGKAALTTRKLWVKLILGMKKLHETVYDPNDSESCLKAFGKKYSYHAKIAQELKERNKYIYWTVMAKSAVTSEREDITKLKEDISKFNQENPVENIKEEMTKLKEDIKQEMRLLYKQSEEELPGCQEIAVQTLAESAAMITGYLRGLDVTGETSILVTNQAQTFHWAGYGLKLHIPQGALPAGLEGCRLLIKVGLSGQFKLPENTSLVSAVYWVDSDPRCKFSQPITLEMQHCVKQTRTSKLSFVHAKCSQVQLPYAFKTVEGGVFSSESAYGCMELYHFSLLGLVINMMLPGVQLYCASLYYLKKGVNQRDIYFVITRNLEAHTTWVQQKYVDRDATVGLDLQVEFESDRISLQGVPFEDGWKIFSLNPQTITKKEVDSFKPGRRIPSCQLKAEWTKQSKPSRFTHKVTLKGAKEPSNYFHIDLDCDSTTPGGNKKPRLIPDHDLHSKYAAGLDSEPDLSDLSNEIAAEIPSKWRDVGQQLGLDQGVLNGIALISPGDTNHCYSNVFTIWKNQISSAHPYTWFTVVQALKTRAVGEVRLAAQIKNKLTGHSTQ